MSDPGLRRQPSTITSLHASRAVAALLVLLCHTALIFSSPKYFGTRPFGHVFGFGYAGVDFFFVLSGFIMMYAHGRDLGIPSRLGSYVEKRFTRIYLPYWLALLCVLPVYLCVPHFGAEEQRQPWIVVASVLLLQHPGSCFVLPVAWTLAYEVFFYAVFALLIVHRRLGICAFTVWIALIATQFQGERFPWNYLTSYYNLCFLAGMAVALFVQQRRVRVPRVVALLGAVVFLATGIVDVYRGPLGLFGRAVGYSAGSALIIAGFVEIERARRLSMPRWLNFVGDASYSIYLVHFPALSLLIKASKQFHLDAVLPQRLLFLSLVGAALAVSCAFHAWMQRPIVAWAKQQLSRLMPARVPVATEPLRKAA